MKKVAIIIVLIALIGIGAWVWLGSKKAVPSGEESITPEEGTELSLAEILGNAAGITSLKYDMVATAPGETAVIMKIWRKENKMRMEGTFEGQSMIYLIDTGKQLSYTYFPLENMAMQIDMSKAQKTAGESPIEQSESVMDYNPVTVGTEALNGKTCLVTEYSTQTGNVKMWVWTKYGLPIKTETTTTKGINAVELKNIDFGSIPDSMFELPAGVQLMEIPNF